MKLRDIKAQLRSGPYAWPGGYPLFFCTSDGAALCFECVRKHWHSVCEAHMIFGYRNSGWRVEAVDCNWEDPILHCDACATRIESAYAEDLNTDDAAAA